MRRVAPLLLAVALGLPATGCGSDSGTSDGHGKPGDAITYAGVGTTMTVDCGDGRSLTVTGSNNTLTVTGRCANVDVPGNDNRLRATAITGRIHASGINNTVRYDDGNPQVDAAAGNTVRKG
ncbi:MAG: DUF3060 domain-containing protein [Mycolicibacterium sp.]|nr:DUF3060 domain-containing protein [Mycolicibacterium sp.]